jgi:hypothetical protein
MGGDHHDRNDQEPTIPAICACARRSRLAERCPAAPRSWWWPRPGWPAAGSRSAGPPRQPPGHAGGSRRGQLLGALPHRAHGAIHCQQFGALDRQHMPHPAPLQPAPQRRIAAIDLIGGHPTGGHAGVQGALQHDPSGLGLVRNPILSGTRAARHRSGSLVQLSGRYSSRSIIARPLGWHRQGRRQAGSCRPCRPCRSTGAAPPTELVPFLRNPVSSTISTAPASPRCSTT